MTDKKPEHDGVKVTDKRRFTEGGDVREPVESDGEADKPIEKAPEATGGEANKPNEGAAQADSEFTGSAPDIDFSTFVLSLATSAQVHLGAIPNPATGKQDSDPHLAKQTIDILGVLEEKTKGNLSEQEKKLMDHLLYDLRMMYMNLLEKKEK